MRCFASELLAIAPRMLAFLEDVMEPRGLLADETRCYRLLVRILQICSFGPRKGAEHKAELRQAIIDHHTDYRKLYPSFIKPKFHAMMHVPENVDYLGVLMSCFVTERKHRLVKRCALWTFREYEHTLIADVVLQELERLRDGPVFEVESLGPSTTHCGIETSTTASFPFGIASKGDFVACRGRRIVQVERFWCNGVGIVAHGRPLVPTDDPRWWLPPTDEVVFVASDAFVGAVTWFMKGGRFRVVLPPDGLGF